MSEGFKLFPIFIQYFTATLAQKSAISQIKTARRKFMFLHDFPLFSANKRRATSFRREIVFAILKNIFAKEWIVIHRQRLCGGRGRKKKREFFKKGFVFIGVVRLSFWRSELYREKARHRCTFLFRRFLSAIASSSY